MSKRIPNTSTLLTIREAAEKLHVSIKTLRRWEQYGLVHPVRNSQNQRLFSETEISNLNNRKYKPLLDNAIAPQTYLTISQAADQIGVSIKTLRRWDSEGKINLSRDELNRRVFTPDTVEYIKNNRAHFSQPTPPITVDVPPIVSPESETNPEVVPAPEIETLSIPTQVKVITRPHSKIATGPLLAALTPFLSILPFILVTAPIFVFSALGYKPSIPVQTIQIDKSKLSSSQPLDIAELGPEASGSAISRDNPIFKNLPRGEVAGVTVTGGSQLSFENILDNNYNFGVAGIVEGNQLVATTTVKPPLVVASQELVENLNADLLDGHSWEEIVQANEVEIDLQTAYEAGNTISTAGQNIVFDLTDSDSFIIDGTGDVEFNATGIISINTSIDANSGLNINSGDLTIGTDKFIVSSETGNTEIKGGLSLAGDLTGTTTTLKSVNNIVLQPNNNSSKFIYLATSNNNPGVFFAGSAATNEPGLRVNNSTGQMEYRDQDSNTWVTLDSLSTGSTTPVLTDGGTFVFPTSRESLRVYDSTGTDYIDVAHDGTQVNITTSGTSRVTLDNNLVITGTNTITLPNSNTMSGVTNFMQFSQGISVGNGTTFNLTAAGNLTVNNAAINGTLTLNSVSTMADNNRIISYNPTTGLVGYIDTTGWDKSESDDLTIADITTSLSAWDQDSSDDLLAGDIGTIIQGYNANTSLLGQTIEESELNISNTPSDGYILQTAADGTLSWVNPGMLTNDDNNYTTGISFSGTTTKTLTLTRDGLPDLIATFTDTDTTYTAGSGLSLTGTELAHGATSAQASIDLDGSVVMQDITLDSFGHLTGYTSVDLTTMFDNYGGWTITDGTTSEIIGSSNTVAFTAGPGISVSYDNTTNTLAIGNTGILSLPQALATTDSPTFAGLTLNGNLSLTGTVDGYDISDAGQYFIDSAGTDTQVWTSDGNGKGYWASLPAGTIYTAGNDIDLVGDSFAIESQLDHVSTISRDSSDLTLQTTTSGNILLNPAGQVSIDGNMTTSGTIALKGASLDSNAAINLSEAVSATSYAVKNTMNVNTGGVYIAPVGMLNTMTLNGDNGTITGIRNNLTVSGQHAGVNDPLGTGVYNNLFTTNDANIQEVRGMFTNLTTYANDVAYGEYITSSSDAGTQYGIYGGFSGTADRYGIYMTGEGKNYFSGNVGIGTTDPQYKLDVDGAINATALYLNNTQVTASASELNLLSGRSGSLLDTNSIATALSAWDQNAADDVTDADTTTWDMNHYDDVTIASVGATVQPYDANTSLLGQTIEESELTISNAPQAGYLLQTAADGTLTWIAPGSVGVDTNDFVDTVSFTNGTLTLGRTGSLPDLTVSLDGRYVLTSDTTTWDQDSSDDLTLTDVANDGFIKDGNTGWDNEYNFITLADLAGWDTDASDDVTDTDTLTWDMNVYDDLSIASISAALTAWDQDASDDITTSNLDASVAGLGFIKDGNSGWDNEYSFITLNDLTGWDTDSSDDLLTSAIGTTVQGYDANTSLLGQTIEESEINISNAPQAGYLLQTGADGTLTWISPGSVGVDTNDYVDEVSFANGTLTLGRTGSLPDLTVSLDGRYVLSSDTTTWDKDTSDDLTLGDVANDGFLKLADLTGWDNDASDDVTDADTFTWDMNIWDDITFDNLATASADTLTAWDQDSSDDITTSNLDASVTTLGYIKDGNTNWDNEYNFITLSDLTGWDTDASNDLTSDMLGVSVQEYNADTSFLGQTIDESELTIGNGPINGYVLQTDGSGNMTWVDPNLAAAATNYWLQTNENIYAKNALYHNLLVGGDSSASATIALEAATGNVKASGSIYTGGTVRIDNTGALSNVTGNISMFTNDADYITNSDTSTWDMNVYDDLSIASISAALTAWDQDASNDLTSAMLGVSVQGYNANTSFLGQTIEESELTISNAPADGYILQTAADGTLTWVDVNTITDDDNNYTSGISFSGTTTKTLTLSRDGMADITATFDDIDTNDYVDTLSFVDGTLTVGRTGALADLTVSLDGRYVLSTDTTNWDKDTTDDYVSPLTTQGDLLYGGTAGAPSRLAGSLTDGHVLKYNTTTNTPYWAQDIDTDTDTNDYSDTLSFSNGTLTIGRTGALPDLTVSLDGRYVLSTDTTNWDKDTTNDLTSDMLGVSVQAYNANTSFLGQTIEESELMVSNGPQAGFVLQTAADGTMTWVNPSSFGGTGYFQINGEQISANNALWNDFLVGGTSTASATIALQANTGNIKATSINGTALSNWDTDNTNDLTSATSFSGDVSGTYNAIAVTDDSHNHTDSTIADAITVSGGTLSSNNVSGTWTTTAGLTIGDNGDAIVIDGSNWDVDTNGKISMNHMNLNNAVTNATLTDGDIWYNGTNLYFRNGSTTTDLLSGGLWNAVGAPSADLTLNHSTYTTTFDSATTSQNFMTMTGNSLTTGTLMNLTSSSTNLASGGLMKLDWSPSGTTEIYSSSELFTLNIGQYGNVSKIFSIKDNGSNVFSVSQTGITSSLPHTFEAPGDVGIANDILMTNQSASYIKSNAPLYIEAGEVFESNNLTLRTYNNGNVILETATSSATLTSAGHFVPSSDELQDLGSPSNRWRDLYLSPNSLHIGDGTVNATIHLNTTTGNLEFDSDADGTPNFVVGDTNETNGNILLAGGANRTISMPVSSDSYDLTIQAGATTWTNGGNLILSGGDGDSALSKGNVYISPNLNMINGGWVGIGTTNPQGPFAVGATFVIDSSGEVGIGTTAPSYKFQVKIDGSNEGHVDATGAWARTSDINFKQNISDLELSLDKVIRLRSVRYDSLSDSSTSGQGKRIGFIAQEVESVFPEFVGTDAEGRKSISYESFVPVLAKAIQELDIKVDANGEMTGLTNKVAEIESQFSVLSAEVTTQSNTFKDFVNNVTSTINNLFTKQQEITAEQDVLKATIADLKTQVATTSSVPSARIDQLSARLTVEQTNIATLSARITALELQATTPSPTPASDLENRLSTLESQLEKLSEQTDMTLPLDATIAALLENLQASESSELSESSVATDLNLDTETIFVSDFLSVMGDTVLTNATVTNTLTVNSISSLNGTLDLMAGLISLDKTGNMVTINGDVNVLGTLTAASLQAPEIDQLASQSAEIASTSAQLATRSLELEALTASLSAKLAELEAKVATISATPTPTPTPTATPLSTRVTRLAR